MGCKLLNDKWEEIFSWDENGKMWGACGKITLYLTIIGAETQVIRVDIPVNAAGNGDSAEKSSKIMKRMPEWQ